MRNTAREKLEDKIGIFHKYQVRVPAKAVRGAEYVLFIGVDFSKAEPNFILVEKWVEATSLSSESAKKFLKSLPFPAKLRTAKNDEFNSLANIQRGSLHPNQIKSFSQAGKIAKELTSIIGRPVLPVDRSDSTSPRFAWVEAPRVGQDVSRFFNGDAYPAGKIVSVNKTFRIVKTSDGSVFWRRRQTSDWLSEGMWSLIDGVHNDRNPHL